MLKSVSAFFIFAGTVIAMPWAELSYGTNTVYAVDNSSKDFNFSCGYVTDNTIYLDWTYDSTIKYSKLFVYVPKTEKYKLVEKTLDSRSWVKELEPEKSYKFCVRTYDNNDRVVNTKYLTVNTLGTAPDLVLSEKNGKCKVSLDPLQDGAAGYELYYRKTLIDSSPISWNILDTNDLKMNQFKLLKKNSDSAAYSFYTGKDCIFVARTFKTVNGKKYYSAFSKIKSTHLPEAYINSLKLNKPNIVVKGEEYELTKKYVDQWITEDMSNWDRFYKIYSEVHSHGQYQDINKIDGNRNVWQIMEKGEGQCAQWAFCCHAMMEYAGFDVRVVRGTREYGGQHFWCQIFLNGKWYDFDPHLGGSVLQNKNNEYMDYIIKEYYD